MNQEDMQIIGTLALEKDTKRKGVFINTKSAIQYVVKSMMSDYKSDKLFTGYMIHLRMIRNLMMNIVQMKKG